MNSKIPYRTVISALLCLNIPVHSQNALPDPATSLLPNGNFQVDANADNWPDGFDRAQNGTWETETQDGAQNRFLRLQQPKDGQFTSLYQLHPLRAGDKNLQLRFRVRTQNVQRGQENYHDARIIFHFKNADRAQVNPDPSPVVLPDNSKEWQQQTVNFAVPDGATHLEIMPTLFQVKSGTLDIDDLHLMATAASAPNTAIARDTTPFTPPPELRVKGNLVQTPDGKSVWLQGVNIPSLEWMPEGEHFPQSVRAALDEWKCSVIRLPVNDEYWFGRHERQKDGGTQYRAMLDNAINSIARSGAYAVLDLHKYRAVHPSAIAFWKEAAAKYKNNSAVWFDIINEPHDISWKVWRDGGTIEQTPAKDGQPAVTYQSPGMQKMVDEIRATGARNIIVAGGLDWAYDLSGILQGFALNDKSGNGIVYSSHIYPWKKDWQGKMLDIAAKHPILLGEVGVDPRPIGDNPNESGYTWAPDMIGTIQKHRLHWTAWSFHTDAAPRILADWEYNPTPFWGAWVKAALLGARFQTNKMR